MNRTTRIAHMTSVVLMGIGVLVATADGFAQSYAGLHHWALEQGLKGWKADTFPLLVDLFVMVGELGLFSLSLEGHRLTRRGLAWVDLALPFGLAAAGWGVSLAFNVGSVHGWQQQVTAAVAPIASMLGLLVLLRTVHRLITRIPQVLDEAPARLVDEPRMNGATVTATVDSPPVPDAEVPVPANGRAVLAPVSDPTDLQLRAAREFADDITAGRVPGIRAIRQQLKIGQPNAQKVRAYLSTLANQ
ncbi:DUF2637 domain-containing protein [Actinomadura geliboluensis]